MSQYGSGGGGGMRDEEDFLTERCSRLADIRSPKSATSSSSFRLNRHSSTIMKTPSKGQRAKRHRRKEYDDVLLECGLISTKEIDAAHGLRALRSLNTKQQLTTENLVPIPSKLESLCEVVEKFVNFVGPSNKYSTVEFLIPQIAHELNITEQTLTFVVDILQVIRVVASRENGAFIWKGTTELWEYIYKNQTLYATDSPFMKLGTNSLIQKISLHYLELFRLHKEPIMISLACEGVFMRLQQDPRSDLSSPTPTSASVSVSVPVSAQLDSLQLNQTVRAISAVFLGIKLIKDVRNRSCIRYMLNSVYHPQHHCDDHYQEEEEEASCCAETEKGSTRITEMKNYIHRCDSSTPSSSSFRSTTMGNGAPHTESWTAVPPFSWPLDLQQKDELLKILQNASLIHAAYPNASNQHSERVYEHGNQGNGRTGHYCNNNGTRVAPMKAAIMEIVGNDISKMHIVDVMQPECANMEERRQSNDSQQPHQHLHFNQREPLIAVAVPEWLIKNQKLGSDRNLSPSPSMPPVPSTTKNDSCYQSMHGLAPPMIMMPSSQSFPQAFLHHHPDSVIPWSGYQEFVLGNFQPNKQQLCGIQKAVAATTAAATSNQVLQYQSHFESIVEFLKDSFETPSKDYLILSDQDNRVQQFPVSRLKQF